MNTGLHQPLKSISVIGFDVRRSPVATAPVLMDRARRSGGLLVPTCPLVLTADRSIWPSIFYLEGRYDAAAVQFPDDIVLPATAGNRYFEAFDLWDNVYAMRSAYVQTATGDSGVAFGLLRPDDYGDTLIPDSWFEAIHEGTGVTPGVAGSDWPFLGFDVVNSGFMSAISGFGSLDDIDALRSRWRSYPNVFGLFERRDVALNYCKEANVRLKGDGPFFVLALFLLWDTTGELQKGAKHLVERRPP